MVLVRIALRFLVGNKKNGEFLVVDFLGRLEEHVGC